MKRWSIQDYVSKAEARTNSAVEVRLSDRNLQYCNLLKKLKNIPDFKKAEMFRIPSESCKKFA